MNQSRARHGDARVRGYSIISVTRRIERRRRSHSCTPKRGKRPERIAGSGGDIEELPTLLGVQEESFHFVGKPVAESSSAAVSIADIATEDLHGFPLGDLLIISVQVTVPIESPDTVALRTGRAFERALTRITLLL